MTEAYEGDWLVRVRAQVMTRDESAEGWVALDGGGLANVMVGKRARRACQLLTNNNGRNGGESSGEESAARPTHAHAPYEYYIYGKRISDQVVVLSCTIKKDFRYNKVMPTFHHWVTDEKRFGLTFQTAADARAFDKGVRIAIEELLDGLGGAWPALHAYQQHNPAPRDDDEENNIFECLNLPSDSRSSSENSTGSRTLQRRGMSESSAQILSAIDLPTMRSRDTPSAPSKELLMQGKQSGAHGDDAEKMCLQLDRDADDYSYVQLTAVHEYTYPQLGTGGVIPPDSSNVEPSAPELESGSIKKRGMPCYKPGPPPLPDKKPSKPESTFQARVKCRHCHEWYLESANRAGACEFAPDCFKSCIDAVTCIKCAQCMMYHCMSDAEGEFATHPCACAPPDDACTKRWAGISLLSLLVPCLCCYPLLRCAHAAARSCRIAGGRHAPHHPTHQ